MDKVLTPQEKLSLITSQLQEVLKPEILEDIVVKQDRPLCIYFGKRALVLKELSLIVLDSRGTASLTYPTRRNCTNGPSSLRLFRPYRQACPFSSCRLPHQDFAC